MRIVLAAALALLVSSTVSVASTRLGGEQFQDELVNAALAREGLAIDTEPEGKRVERIVVVPYDVILESDPFPRLLNILHATTESDVAARELLFSAGDAWNAELIEESARNLRSYLFLSMARIIPVRSARGPSSDSVSALVVTKDLWSLRTNWDFSLIGSTFEQLELQLEERNLGGRNRNITADFNMNLGAWSLGEIYSDPWFAGQRLVLTQRAAAIVNRTTGRTEGGVAKVGLESPLHSLSTEWGWNANASWRYDVYRLFSGGQLVDVPTSTGELLPYQFRRRRVDLVASGVRSFGRARKLDLTFGWRAFDKNFDPVDSTASAAALAEFRASIFPFSESAGMLFAGVRSYRPEFVRRMDIESYAITEDYLLGPDAAVEVRWANPAFGYSSSFGEGLARFDWTESPADSVVSAGFTLGSRYQPEQGGLVDNGLSLRTHEASPVYFRLFRLIFGARLILHVRDLDHAFESFGGEGVLRGYPSSYFRGARVWSSNFEARTLPFEWHTVHLGLATFLDVGGVAEVSSDSTAHADGRAHASTGVGVRMLFPQFNRLVLRADLAFPLERTDGDPAYFSARFGQAF